MKKSVLVILVAASMVLAPKAFAFQPGEKVTVRSSNQMGTVLEDKGGYVKVHIDSSGYSADVGIWVDKSDLGVAGAANGGTAQQGNTGNTVAPTASAPTGSATGGKRITVGKRSGTILEDKGNIIKVHFDDSGYSHDVGIWLEKDKLNEAAAANAPVANAPAHAAPAHPNQNHPNVPVNKAPIDAPNTAQAGDVAVGTPPDGLYQCNKISLRSYIHIGTIEIRGKTYKGFSSQQGSFHPYSMDGAGNITWTGGLTGMPDGWSLKPGKYVGPDSSGHPRIRIYYTSPRGAAEVVDATKEK